MHRGLAVRGSRIIASASRSRDARPTSVQEILQGRHDDPVVLNVRETGDGHRADHALISQGQREGAAVRGVPPLVQAGVLVEGPTLRTKRQPTRYEERRPTWSTAAALRARKSSLVAEEPSSPLIRLRTG